MTRRRRWGPTRPASSAPWVAAGDTLVVADLSRLGRYTAGVVEILDALDSRGVGLSVLELGVDTGTPAGRVLVSALSAAARLEIDLTRERLAWAAEAARPQRRAGRPPALNPLQRAHAVSLARSGTAVSEIAELMNVSERVIRGVVAPQDRTGRSR